MDRTTGLVLLVGLALSGTALGHPPARFDFYALPPNPCGLDLRTPAEKERDERLEQVVKRWTMSSYEDFAEFRTEHADALPFLEAHREVLVPRLRAQASDEAHALLALLGEKSVREPLEKLLLASADRHSEFVHSERVGVSAYCSWHGRRDALLAIGALEHLEQEPLRKIIDWRPGDVLAQGEHPGCGRDEWRLLVDQELASPSE